METDSVSFPETPRAGDQRGFSQKLWFPKPGVGDGCSHMDPLGLLPSGLISQAAFSLAVAAAGLTPLPEPGQRERISTFCGSDWSVLGHALIPEPITMARGACRALIGWPGMALRPLLE